MCGKLSAILLEVESGHCNVRFRRRRRVWCMSQTVLLPPHVSSHMLDTVSEGPTTYV